MPADLAASTTKTYLAPPGHRRRLRWPAHLSPHPVPPESCTIRTRAAAQGPEEQAYPPEPPTYHSEAWGAFHPSTELAALPDTPTLTLKNRVTPCKRPTCEEQDQTARPASPVHTPSPLVPTDPKINSKSEYISRYHQTERRSDMPSTSCTRKHTRSSN